MTFKRVESRPEFVSYFYTVIGSNNVRYETSNQQEALEYAKNQVDSVCGVTMYALLQFSNIDERDLFVNVTKEGYPMSECRLGIVMSGCLFLYGKAQNRGRGFKF